jgi:hypothetical protein
MVTEIEARRAPKFIVDWRPNEAFPDFIEEESFADYAKVCAFARKTARKFGGAYLMPVIGGKKAAQWIYSDRYPRHFDA